MAPIAAGGHRGVAVVRDAVALVLAVGLHQPLHDRIDAVRAVNRHRRAVRAGHPALQQQFTQPVDMVRMEVGQEDGLDRALVEAHAADVAAGRVAGVEDQQMLACQHHGAGAGALLVRKRRAGAAQADMQTVGQLRSQIGRHALLGEMGQHGHAQRSAQQVGQQHEQHQREHAPKQNPARACHASGAFNRGAWPSAHVPCRRRRRRSQRAISTSVASVSNAGVR